MTDSINQKRKEKKIKQYLYLLDEVVCEFENSGESAEKLKTVGYIGLLNAFNLYPTLKGNLSFENYAKTLIAGEIRQYIREKHKKVIIPEWLILLNQKMNYLLISYHREYKRFPNLQEIRKIFNLSEEGLQEMLKARESVHKVSIDQKRREKDIKESPDIKKIRTREKNVKK